MSIDAFHRIQAEIAACALKSGRKPEDVQLVAVTKNHSWPESSFLYEAGQRHFGENRVKEALEKQSEAPSDCQWHLIGTLQSNKVNKVVDKFTLIHSVDTFELASKISQVATSKQLICPILLQVNVSGEISKHGNSPEEWKRVYDELFFLSGLRIEGLMTMAPLGANEHVARICFSGLREFKEELQILKGIKLQHLSMGMSDDFKWAIAEGATIVRVGSALFD